MSTLKQRFLLVSDMHYTTEETAAQLKLQYPNAIASAAAGNAFGKTQKEKVETILADILREHSRHPLDAVLVLGDLSIDDAPYRNLPQNFCRKFKEECLDRLPCPSYTIPGNHDSYPDSVWKEIFGYDRQYAVELGECVFLMADTFAKLPATGASGSDYSLLDEDFLRTQLQRFAGKKIFLCAHYLDTAPENNRNFTPGVCRLLADNADLVCMFRGHTHANSVSRLESKQILDIGGYGYDGQLVNGKWDFNMYDPRWAWGYQILEVYDDCIRAYHVKRAMDYAATNGQFHMPETVEDEICFPLN